MKQPSECTVSVAAVGAQVPPQEAWCSDAQSVVSALIDQMGPVAQRVVHDIGRPGAEHLG